MNEEELKALAKERNISVAQLKEELGITGEVPTFDDKPQDPARAAEEEKEEADAAAAAEYAQSKSDALKVIPGKSGQTLAGIKMDAVNEAAGIKKGLAEDTYKKNLEIIDSEKARQKALEGIMAENTKAQDELNETYRKAVETANAAQERENRATLQRYIDDADLARKENEIRSRNEANKVLWGSAAELGAAIANLIGVSRGAVSQATPNVIADWMKQADMNRKDRIRRIDSLEARRNAIEQQLSALKAAGAKEGAKNTLQNATYKLGREEEQKKMTLQNESNIDKMRLNADTQAATAKAEADIAEATGKGEALSEGFKFSKMRSGSGRTTTTTTDKSSKKSGNYQEMTRRGYYPFLIDGEEYWMDDKTLFRNIQTLKNKISIVNKADRDEFEALKTKPQDDQVKFLLSVMDSNPEMKAALKQLSPGKVNDDDDADNKGENGESASSQAAQIFG